ncbi:MAG: GNAT family N-acetyltransferase [Proteobacteria bacterium]|nr:GNAT family N-acetyltransferase [Pseudomonadota bacterium]MDA1289554.1 GNAT family N-acetyltransferase [Pseudomonadota bacterium]
MDELRKKPIQCLIVSIALPNVSSVALHENLGFVKAGQFSEIGYKSGKFVDVGYWKLKL